MTPITSTSFPPIISVSPSDREAKTDTLYPLPVYEHAPTISQHCFIVLMRKWAAAKA